MMWSELTKTSQKLDTRISNAATSIPERELFRKLLVNTYGYECTNRIIQESFDAEYNVPVILRDTRDVRKDETIHNDELSGSFELTKTSGANFRDVMACWRSLADRFTFLVIRRYGLLGTVIK